MDAFSLKEREQNAKALGELGKASKLLHQLVIAACAAMIAFALTPDPADNYRKALVEVQTLEGLTREQYSTYVLDRLKGHRKELATFDKLPFTEPGPKFMLNKYTIDPVTYISWPTDAPLAEVIAFFEGNNEAIQYGPAEEKELDAAVYLANQDRSQSSIPQGAPLQDGGFVIPNTVAKIKVGKLRLLEKSLPLDVHPIEVSLSYESNSESGSSITARYTPVLHSVEEYRISHANLALDWLQSQGAVFSKVSKISGGRTVLFPEIKNAFSEIEGSPLRAATGKLQDKIDSMRHDIHFPGLTIDERIAVWAAPAILLALLLYFYAHFHAFARQYRELSPVATRPAWVCVLEGPVSASLSNLSIMVMPILTIALLLWRLGHFYDLNTVVGTALDVGVLLTAAACSLTLEQVRRSSSNSRELDASKPLGV